jgi:hypothetical protein
MEPPDRSEDLLGVTLLDAEVARLASLGRRREDAHTFVQASEARAADEPGACLSFDGYGRATLRAGDDAGSAGSMFTPTLAQLRAWADARVDPGAGDKGPRLFVLSGEHPITDIGALQAFAPPATLFPVASQFNCLESPGALRDLGGALPQRLDAGAARGDLGAPEGAAAARRGADARRPPRHRGDGRRAGRPPRRRLPGGGRAGAQRLPAGLGHPRAGGQRGSGSVCT